MVRVLVTGANGYIGYAVASHLRSQGHLVYGLIRSDKYEKKLLQAEILPVIGNFDDIASWKSALQNVAVVIDTVSPHGDSAEAKQRPHLQFAQALAELAKATQTQRHYIYTSGCLVYGDYPNLVIDETFERKQPGFEWRVQLEHALYNVDGIATTVVRPAWVYGGNWGNYLAGWFKGNDKGEIVVFGNSTKRWSWIHIADLASAYRCIIESPVAAVNRQTFDVADSTRATFGEVKVAAARAAGVTGQVVSVPAATDVFAVAMEANTILRAERIRLATGWRPRHNNLLDSINLYAKSVKAYQ